MLWDSLGSKCWELSLEIRLKYPKQSKTPSFSTRWRYLSQCDAVCINREKCKSYFLAKITFLWIQTKSHFFSIFSSLFQMPCISDREQPGGHAFCWTFNFFVVERAGLYGIAQKSQIAAYIKLPFSSKV